MLIAGGGIGGLAAATALARAGHRVRVLERAPAPAEAGAGLQLSPNASRILIGWGLGAALSAVAGEPEAAEVRDAQTGRPLLRTPLGPAARARWRAPYWQAHRADLHAALAEAALAAGAELSWGAEVAEVAPDRAELALTSGERLAADLLVGADGVRSRVAEALFAREPARFTGQVAWRAVVSADRLAAGGVENRAIVWTGPGRHLVTYPLRRGRLVNLVAVVEQAGWTQESWRAPGDPAELRAAFAAWPAEVARLLAEVDETWRWAIFERPPRPRWSTASATLLGDAAHAMAPFLAQGAAQAIEDAEALARHLSAASLPDALAAYAAERQPRTARIQAASRRNGTIFHLPPTVQRLGFGAAGVLDRLRPGGEAARFDWLYGYVPPGLRSAEADARFLDAAVQK